MTNIFNNRNMDLTTGSTRKLISKVIIYSLPIIIVGCLEFLFNTFDLIVIEQKEGNVAASAVGANSALIALLTNVFLGLSTGENVVIAKYYGRGDKDSVLRSAYSGIVLSLISGLLVAIVGYFLAPYLLKLIQVGQDHFELEEKYLRIYFFCLPFMSLYNFCSAIYRGIGDSITPLIFLIISGIIHIALNYLFVFAFSWSVAGAAFSNIISYFIVGVLILLFLRFKTKYFKFRFKGLRLFKKETMEIIKVGVPSGIQGMIFATSNLILQSSVNTWGTTIITVNADCESIENLGYTAMFACAQAGSAFISANYGKGEKKNVKKLIWIIEGVTVSFGLTFSLILLALYRPLIIAYSGGKADAEFFALCFERLSLLLPLYFLCGAMETMTNILRGLNRAVIPMVITIFFVCLFRVFWNFYVYSPDPNSQFHSTVMLYLCYPVSWITSLSFQIVYYLIVKKSVFTIIEFINLKMQGKNITERFIYLTDGL